MKSCSENSNPTASGKISNVTMKVACLEKRFKDERYRKLNTHNMKFWLYASMRKNLNQEKEKMRWISQTKQEWVRKGITGVSLTSL
jgi:hypothetical protein